MRWLTILIHQKWNRFGVLLRRKLAKFKSLRLSIYNTPGLVNLVVCGFF